MLTSRAATQAELGRLTEGRNAAVAAEAVALRRLERDIHDGPQQRLVRLSMDLSRAQRQLDRDPGAARATLDEAAGLARETLEELRALSRGIAPPVLADRGLAAALAALAARSPVPVDLAVDLPAAAAGAGHREHRLLRRQRGAGQRGQAQRRDAPCRVDVWLRRAAGCGSSSRTTAPAARSSRPGHGLAGLTDRLQAVDGVLTVDSPRGGPTRLTAELPCG